MKLLPRRWAIVALVAAVALLGAVRMPAGSVHADSDQQMALIKQDTFTHAFADPLSAYGALVRRWDVYAVLRPRLGPDGKTWYPLLTEDRRAVGWVTEDQIELFTISAP